MPQSARYFLGAALAVLAGAVFNLGVLLQKKAVNAVPAGDGGPLMRTLVRNKTWILGLALQFAVGTPMYTVAQLFIGPSLIPGLMASGLVVIALGSPAVAGEPLRWGDLGGVFLVIAAVVLLGLSNLTVDLDGFELIGGPLLVRYGAGTGAMTALFLGLLGVGGARRGWKGVTTILAAGIALSVGNLWSGILMAGLARLLATGSGGGILAVMCVSAVAVIVANVVAMVATQHAFRKGRAAVLVPVQQIPVQIIPAASYFVLFRLAPPGPATVPLAVCGVALILAGSTLVGRGGHLARPAGARVRGRSAPPASTGTITTSSSGE